MMSVQPGGHSAKPTGISMLTQSERATYACLRSKGYTHNESINDALDGVHVDDARKLPKKPPKKRY